MFHNFADSMWNYFAVQAKEFIPATRKSVSVLPCPGLCLVTPVELQIFGDLTYTNKFIGVKKFCSLNAEIHSRFMFLGNWMFSH